MKISICIKSYFNGFCHQFRLLILNPYMLVVALYLCLNLTNLTLLPIFNDEAIYLDWSWFSIHVPRRLYDPLLDAKQPLMIWIFGVVGQFFEDPLFAGRFVSVLIGCFTLLGVYTLTRRVFDRHTALFASLLYAITPIFVFYNRQALMESAIACVGIWSGIALLTLLRHPTTQNGIRLGIIWGVGFFIKSTTLVFLFASLLVVAWYYIHKKQTNISKPYLISFATAVGVCSLLLINPVFWQTFSSNNRYVYSLNEMFSLPLVSWVNHLVGFFGIGFIFITPVAFVVALIGIYRLRKGNADYKFVLLYFVTALILEIVSVKSQSQRYLVAFLPFLMMPAAYVLAQLWKKTLFNKWIVCVTFLVSVLVSLLLIVNPAAYITTMSKVSQYAPKEYLFGQTAGYGINESLFYINQHASANQQTLVMFGLGTGNPENAIDLYSYRKPQLIPLHIDATLFPGLNEYSCLTSRYPLFIVTRDRQLLGLERYVSLVESFPNLDTSYAIRIYTLKKNCNGKTLILSDIYESAIRKVIEMKHLK